MSLSDCPQCWETPCRCGFEYKDWSKEQVAEFIKKIIRYLPKDEQVLIIQSVLNEITTN